MPQKEKHILERIDPELRMQIGKALLEDPDNLLLGEEVGKGMIYCTLYGLYIKGYPSVSEGFYVSGRSG